MKREQRERRDHRKGSGTNQVEGDTTVTGLAGVPAISRAGVRGRRAKGGSCCLVRLGRSRIVSNSGYIQHSESTFSSLLLLSLKSPLASLT